MGLLENKSYIEVARGMSYPIFQDLNTIGFIVRPRICFGEHDQPPTRSGECRSVEEIDFRHFTVDELWLLAEENTRDFDHGYANLFQAIRDKLVESGADEIAIRNSQWELNIHGLITRPSPEPRFSHRFLLGDAAGNKYRIPDPDNDFPDEVLNYIAQRLTQTHNPLLRARYADLMWEKKREPEYARVAIEGYMDSANIFYDQGSDFQVQHALERVLSITCTIKDRDGIVRCFSQMLQFMDQLIQSERFDNIPDFVNSLLSRKRYLPKDFPYNRLIDMLEKGLAFFANQSGETFPIQKIFLEHIGSVWGVLKQGAKVRESQVRIAEMWIEAGRWTKKHYPPSNDVAYSFYKDAMNIYLTLGGYTDKVDELKKAIHEELLPENRRHNVIATPIELSRSELDAIICPYHGMEPKDILGLLSEDDRFIPLMSEATELLEIQRKETPLLVYAPVVVTQGGIVVKELREQAELESFRITQNLVFSYKYDSHFFIDAIFELMKTSGKSFSSEIMTRIKTSSIIKTDRHNLILHGILAFEREDYISSIHILLFQFEGILRDTLHLLGRPVFSIKNGEHRARQLGDIISELGGTSGMPTDYLNILKVFMCDMSGENLRNRVAHGLAQECVFTKENASYLLYLLIIFTSFRIDKTVPSTNIELESEDGNASGDGETAQESD